MMSCKVWIRDALSRMSWEGSSFVGSTLGMGKPRKLLQVKLQNRQRRGAPLLQQIMQIERKELCASKMRQCRNGEPPTHTLVTIHAATSPSSTSHLLLSTDAAIHPCHASQTRHDGGGRVRHITTYCFLFAFSDFSPTSFTPMFFLAVASAAAWSLSLSLCIFFSSINDLPFR